MFNQFTRFRFWFQWVVVNTLSLTMGFILAGTLKDLNARNHIYFIINSPNIIDCIIGGLMLGVAEWLSLKKLFPNLSLKWILTSSITLPISILTSLAIYQFLIWFYFFHASSSIKFTTVLLVSVGFVGGTLGGVIAGLFQQKLLKQHLQSIRLTVLLLANIIGSAVGWAASWSAAFYVEYITINFYQVDSQTIVLSALGATFGLTNSAIVGGGLIWVLRRSRLVI